MSRRHRANPSFSSSLLDEIYRSIDGGDSKSDDEMFVYSKKRTEYGKKKTNEKVVRTGLPARVEKLERNINNNWSSTSSDQSSSGEFSDHRPKPVRTSVPARDVRTECIRNEKGFGKTKSRAMKIYGDLKKVKQPISPGGRLTTFLNSLFHTSTPKKAKISSSTQTSFDQTISHHNLKSKSSCTSTCSSASSFSRSCLSNSSSREKTSNGAKRSVRFYPVSVVLGQDNKNEMRNSINEEIKLRIMEKNRRVEEAARDLLKSYQKVEYEIFHGRDTQRHNENFFNDHDDDDDDAASYASSDLFEIDHLSAVEELPVYETTHFRKNLAIANGLMS